MVERGLSRRRFLTLSGVGAGLVVAPSLLSACTSTKGTPISAAGTNGVLRVGWTSEPDVMNPFTMASSAAAEILALVYDNLMDYGADLKPEPALAKSSSYSTDGKSITYDLRTGVTWQDGEPFTCRRRQVHLGRHCREQSRPSSCLPDRISSPLRSLIPRRWSPTSRSRRPLTQPSSSRSCPSTSGARCLAKTSRSHRTTNPWGLAHSSSLTGSRDSRWT